MEEPVPTPLKDGALRKMLISILLVLAVGSAAYLGTREPEPPGRENLIDLSVRDSQIDPVIVSEAASDVESYIQEIFQINVKLPSIRDAKISGAGVFKPRPGISIPAVLFEDPHADIERILVFTYSLLDRWAEGAFLERSIRLELEHDRSKVVVSASDGREIVLNQRKNDSSLWEVKHPTVLKARRYVS